LLSSIQAGGPDFERNHSKSLGPSISIVIAAVRANIHDTNLINFANGISPNGLGFRFNRVIHRSLQEMVMTVKGQQMEATVKNSPRGCCQALANSAASKTSCSARRISCQSRCL
jgi:hypothetical protein